MAENWWDQYPDAPEGSVAAPKTRAPRKPERSLFGKQKPASSYSPPYTPLAPATEDKWAKYEDAPQTKDGYEPPYTPLKPADPSAHPGTMAGVSRALEVNLPFVDRAVALAKAKLPKEYGGTGQDYATALAEEKAKEAQFAEQHPWTTAVGGLAAYAPAGGFLPAGGPSLAGQMGAGAATGYGLGVLSGISESPDLTDTAATGRAAARGGLEGAAFGAAVPPVARAVGAGVSRLGRAFRGAEPQRALTPEEWAAAAKGEPAAPEETHIAPEEVTKGEAPAPGKPAEGGPAGAPVPMHPPERQGTELSDAIARWRQADLDAVNARGTPDHADARARLEQALTDVEDARRRQLERPAISPEPQERTPQHEGRDVPAEAPVPGKVPAGEPPIGEAPRKGANVSTVARRKAEDYRVAMAENTARIKAAFKEAGIPEPENDHVMAEAASILRKGETDDPVHAWEMAEESLAAHEEHRESIGMGEKNPFAQGSPDYNAFERQRETETLLGNGEKVPVAEIIHNPGMFGVGAAPSKAAQIFAKVGKVNRFVLRKLENAFDRGEGAINAARTRVVNDLYKFGVSFRTHVGFFKPGGLTRKIKGLNVTQEMRERVFRYAERDPQIVLTPDEERLFKEHILPMLRENKQIWLRIKARRQKGEVPEELLEEIENLNPDRGYIHRRTINAVKYTLGLEQRDPVTGYRSSGFMASAEKPRKFFVIDDGQGTRRVVYIKAEKKNEMYRVSRDVDDEMVTDKIKGDFVPKKGARIDLAGREWRVEDALTREIEEAGGPIYVKDAIAATRVAHLELTKAETMLKIQAEARQSLIDQGLASRSNKTLETKFWRKSTAPGFGGLYMPERVHAVVKTRSERLGPPPEANIVWDPLRYVGHKMIGTLFWNPVFHAANVAAHAFIERGWRNINPVANVRYVGFFREAMRDVATQNHNYREAQENAAVLMLGPRRANRYLTHLMFDGVKELQETPQGQGLLKRIYNVGKIPFDSVIGGYGRWAGDAMWQLGDILTMSAIKERQFYNKGESLAESIMKVHRELPTYRSPVESVLPGKAGRFIGAALKDPAVGTFMAFVPYHENILRGLVMIGEDIVQGAIHLKDPAARKGAGEALGKIAAISGALWVYNKGLDPIARRMAGDDQQAKRFGPFSYLQLVMDQVEGRHLSLGAKTKLLTAGMYSPAPPAEMLANLYGYHGYSMSPMQPSAEALKTQPIRRTGQEVPLGERAAQMAISGVLPTSQLLDIIGDPKEGLLRALGPTQFRRKTEAEQQAASKERRDTPVYKAAAALRKREKAAEKRRHEDSLPRWSPW